MKIVLHVIILALTVTLSILGIFAWRFGLEIIEDQTFHYDAVTSGEITRAKAEDSGEYVSPGLRYIFKVNGRDVVGENYRRNLIKKKEFSKAREIAKSHEPGSKVKVYYRVDGNGQVHSVLNPHPESTAHLLYVGGVPLSFFVIGLYLTIAAPRLFNRSNIQLADLSSSEKEKKKEKKEKEGTDH